MKKMTNKAYWLNIMLACVLCEPQHDAKLLVGSSAQAVYRCDQTAIYKMTLQAMEYYAEQSNSHKHGVMQAEVSKKKSKPADDLLKQAMANSSQNLIKHVSEGAAVGNGAAGKGVSDGK